MLVCFKASSNPRGALAKIALLVHLSPYTHVKTIEPLNRF
jgi:hypothetical protein